MDNTNNIEKLHQIISATEAKVMHPGPDDSGRPFMLVPHGYSVEGLSHLLDKPYRTKRTLKFQDADSFIQYVKEERDTNSQMHADVDRHVFRDTIDFHGGWAEHVAIYACPPSDEWTTWVGNNKHKFDQVSFAEFIEDNLRDIFMPDASAPDGMTMLEIAKNLQAKRNVEFASAVRLDNGDVQFKYEEETAGTTAKGNLSIPEAFYIAIPPFVNSPAYQLKARLRWRLNEGRVTFTYELDRPDKVAQDAFDELKARITSEVGTDILSVHIDR